MSTFNAVNLESGSLRPGHDPVDHAQGLSSNKGNKFIARGETDVSEAGMRSAPLTLYPAGTVSMSSGAPAGYLAIALNRVSTNQWFKSFAPSKGYGASFVYYAVERSLPMIIQYASGSTFVEISGGVLKPVHAVLPDKSVTSAFCSLIEPMVERRKLAELENVALPELRDWLRCLAEGRDRPKAVRCGSNCAAASSVSVATSCLGPQNFMAVPATGHVGRSPYAFSKIGVTYALVDSCGSALRFNRAERACAGARIGAKEHREQPLMDGSAKTVPHARIRAKEHCKQSLMDGSAETVPHLWQYMVCRASRPRRLPCHRAYGRCSD